MPFRCYPCPRTPVTHVPRTNTLDKERDQKEFYESVIRIARRPGSPSAVLAACGGEALASLLFDPREGSVVQRPYRV